MFCNRSCCNKFYHNKRRNNYVTPTKQSCRICKKIKPLSQFTNNPQILSGKDRRCKRCKLTKFRELQYGLTPDLEVEMLKKQSNVCAICGSDSILCVDHDHHTGVIRGLLCYKCNTSLGGFGDNLEGLLKAVAYLERNLNADND